jgi:hypothetical protein
MPCHGHTDLADALVDLQDGVPVDDDASSPEAWRCKACPAVFDDYCDAVAHADTAHPDRVVIDVRHAVEPA